MNQSDIQQIAEFEEHFAKAQATDVIELPWGFALLQRDFPLSHGHNRIVVKSAASSAEILQAADDVLGGAGFEHRYISVLDDARGHDLEPDFIAAGYEAESLVTMIKFDLTAETPAHDIHAVSHVQLRPAVLRDWKVDLPDASDEALAQLADRMTLYSRGAEVTFLAAFEDSEIASRVELYLDRGTGVAQIESLQTHHDYRRRGYAKAVVEEANRRAVDAGCRFSFLVADLDDWPRQWYSRLGYVETDRTRDFIRQH